MSKCMNMCHDIMAHTLFLQFSMSEVNVVDVGLHLCKLLFCDCKAKFLRQEKRRETKVSLDENANSQK